MTLVHTTLDPRRADPFEAYHTVYRDKARLQWTVLGLVASQIILIFALVVVAMRPARVIIKDRIDGHLPQLSVTEAAPAVTQTDARWFFINMVRLRFGWDSLTVERDMRTYLGQCVAEQRALEMGHLQTLQASDAPTKQPPRSRLQGWVVANIQNTLVLPDDLEAVSCRAQNGLWHCYMQASIVTQSLGYPNTVRAPPARVAFLATLLEVPHTTGTLSGLVVGAMRQMPVPSDKEPS